MANIFTITTPTQTLKADANGQATFAFTVTNTMAHPLRGIAKVKPLDKTQAQWLKIDGETERDFPTGGTHQFTVNFSKPKPPAPPTTIQPAESYQFRLDAISATNPDEDFTEGPVVTVEFPEIKPTPPPSPKWWIWIIIGAVILLIIIGVILYLIFGRGGGQVEVPDVTNKTFAEANTSLQNVKLQAVKVDAVANNKEPNKIFQQDPTAGTKVEANTNVNVSIPAMTTVPRVVGLKIEDARTQLSQRGLTMSDPIASTDVPTTVAVGTVGFQFPLANSSVLKGTEVKIFVPCRVGIRCFIITDTIGVTRLPELDRRNIEDQIRIIR